MAGAVIDRSHFSTATAQPMPPAIVAATLSKCSMSKPMSAGERKAMSMFSKPQSQFSVTLWTTPQFFSRLGMESSRMRARSMGLSMMPACCGGYQMRYRRSSSGCQANHQSTMSAVNSG